MNENYRQRFINYEDNLYLLSEIERHKFKETYDFIRINHVPEGLFKILGKYNHNYQFIYKLVNNHVLPEEWKSKKFFMKDRQLISVLDMKSGLERFKEHKRLKVFYNKGLECANPNCDEVGYYLLLTLGVKTIEVDALGYGIHADVFTKDLKLMTVDHILPKSKGGTYDLDNLRPMCYKCNQKLGHSQAY